MDSDTTCTGRLVLLLSLPQTSITLLAADLHPAAPLTRTLHFINRLWKEPCTRRDSYATLLDAALSIFCKVVTDDKCVSIICNGCWATRAKQLQSSSRRRAQQEVVLLSEILPSYWQGRTRQWHQKRGWSIQYFGDQISGCGSGGNQGHQQQPFLGNHKGRTSVWSDEVWSRLSSEWNYRREQVQHLCFCRVDDKKKQEHVRWTEFERTAGESKENKEEKRGNSLLAHCGAATMMGHISKLWDIHRTYSHGFKGLIWTWSVKCTEKETNKNIWRGLVVWITTLF